MRLNSAHTFSGNCEARTDGRPHGRRGVRRAMANVLSLLLEERGQELGGGTLHVEDDLLVGLALVDLREHMTSLGPNQGGERERARLGEAEPQQNGGSAGSGCWTPKRSRTSLTAS